MAASIDRHGVNQAPRDEPTSVKQGWQAPTLTQLGDAATLTAGGKLDATLDAGAGLS